MNTPKERIAYLRGLIEGSEAFASDKDIHVIWDRLLEILDELAESDDELRTIAEDHSEYLEVLDADLAELETDVYLGDDEVEVGGEETIELECPNCQHPLRFGKDFLYDEDVCISCPECGEVIYMGDNYLDDVFDEKGEDGDGDDGP